MNTFELEKSLFSINTFVYMHTSKAFNSRVSWISRLARRPRESRAASFGGICKHKHANSDEIIRNLSSAALIYVRDNNMTTDDN